MSTRLTTRHLTIIAWAALILLAAPGCITIEPEVYARSVAYEPEKSATRIEATAALRISHTLSPEVRAIWKKWLNSDSTIQNYTKGVADVIANDIVASGVFTRVDANATSPDFILSITSEERIDPQGKLVIQFDLRTPNQTIISQRKRETPLGMTMATYNMKEALPTVMSALKADMVADILAYWRQLRQQAEQAEAAAFAQASLSDLLISSDRSVSTARARNRAIIATKNQQLPVMLRDHKTAELDAMVVKLEQVILDLNHESEVAKDRAQQAMANNGPADQIEEFRGLAICYRERIELLKPILAALKEEIANRNR